MRPDGPLRKPLAWVREKHAPTYTFLTTEKGKSRLVREGLGIVLLVGVLMLSLWAYTGQSLDQSPVVVVESGSMMHCENGVGNGPPNPTPCDSSSFGRLGTIDPGDLILIKDVDGASDVATYAEGGKHRYGKSGDVIVYQPYGRDDLTPVIHRALFWIEIHDDDSFSIPAIGLERSRDITAAQLEELGVHHGEAARANRAGSFVHLMAQDCHNISGFVTRGDNNVGQDVGGGGSIGGPCPIREDWVIGKSRGEIPWIGTLKLLITDKPNYDNAPGDIKGFMWLTVGLIVGGPFIVDLVTHKVLGRKAAREAATEEGSKESVEDAEPDDGPTTERM